MRVSSLSDRRIQALIASHFVPAWLSRDRYQLGKVDQDERAFVAKLDSSRRERKLEGGAVCVYIVSAKGEAVASLPVQKAGKPELLLAFLKKVIDDEKLAAREPSKIAPVAAETRKPSKEGARLFGIWTRFDGKENRGTSRDLIELTKEEWSAFVPEKAAKGHAWRVARASAEKLLKHAYPPLPHWDAKLARIVSCAMTASVESVEESGVRIRLEGKLELIYPDKGNANDGRVTASFAGTVRWDGKRGLTSFELASDEASYVWYWEGKAQTKAMSFAVALFD